jgi:acetyltransferase-like isoleucine patch superfamily enzyme
LAFSLREGLSKAIIRNTVVLRILWKVRFPKCNVAFDYPPKVVPNVAVGDYSYSSEVSLLLASPWKGSNVPLVIGKYCSIGPSVAIELSTGHDTSDRALYPLSVDELEGRSYSKGGVFIGNDVWIGQGVLIRSGVKLGNSSVVAAKSVVVHDVPDYCVVAGAPAKVISHRQRPDWVSDPWWEWGDDKLRLNMGELKRYLFDSRRESGRNEV